MANLKEVRDRISSVKSTQQITKAMKMVSAAKLRRAQDAIIQLRPYAEKLNTILSRVSSGADKSVETKYAEEREVKNVLIVVVTSDRGLCGGFNANASKAVLRLIDEKYKAHQEAGKVQLLSVGKKGFEYFERRDYSITTDYTELFLNLSFDKVKDAAEYVMDAFANETYDVVEVVYNEFKNVATQVVRTEQFLPLTANIEGGEQESEIDYIFEPNKEYIIQELIPKSLKVQFYKFVLESNASEHGARMTAMDKATDNAGELLKDLNLAYNRSRQAAITTEILEIVGGAEALANG